MTTFLVTFDFIYPIEWDYCAPCWYTKGEEEENILHINYCKIKSVKIYWTTNMKKYHEFGLPCTTMHLKGYVII